MLLIAVMLIAVIIIIRMVVAVVTKAAVMAPGKGSEKNPEKSSLRRGRRSPSRVLIQNGARVRVISAPINISPAQKG